MSGHIPVCGSQFRSAGETFDQVKPCQVKSGQVRLGNVKSGQDKVIAGLV